MQSWSMDYVPKQGLNSESVLVDTYEARIRKHQAGSAYIWNGVTNPC